MTLVFSVKTREKKDKTETTEKHCVFLLFLFYLFFSCLCFSVFFGFTFFLILCFFCFCFFFCIFFRSFVLTDWGWVWHKMLNSRNEMDAHPYQAFLYVTCRKQSVMCWWRLQTVEPRQNVGRFLDPNYRYLTRRWHYLKIYFLKLMLKKNESADDK